MTATKKSKFNEPVEHGSWTNAAQFMITSIGLAVGLGNVWRFPYVVYKNGGAAFLVAYIPCMILIAMPLLLLETAMGQYTRKGPVGVWNMSPLFRGIGWAMMFTNICITAYYNTPIAWAAFYFIKSFTTELPWKADANATGSGVVAAENYFYNETLKLSSAVDDIGEFCWELYLCNAALWAFVYSGVFLGAKSLGRMAYFTSSFSYVMLATMLVYGATLPGAYKGVEFYITHVEWDALLDVQLWRDAIAQVLFSTSCAGGSLINMASYNRFDHNIYRDAIILPVADTLTSIFAGFSVFTVLGHIAHRSNISYVGDVVKSGPGLIFISYPEVFAAIDGGYVWSALFFFMVFLLGMSSQIPSIDMFCSVIGDSVPALRKTRIRNLLFRLSFVVFMFSIATIFYFGVGYYWYSIVDERASGIPLIILAICELIGAGWVYNKPFYANKVLKNIEEMVGKHWSPRYWHVWKYSKYLWLASWAFVGPITLTFILIYDFANLGPLEVNGYLLPDWAVNCSWAITGTAMFIIVAWMIVIPCWRYGGYSAWLEASQPMKAWKRAAPEPEPSTVEKPEMPVPNFNEKPPIPLQHYPNGDVVATIPL